MFGDLGGVVQNKVQQVGKDVFDLSCVIGGMLVTGST